MTNPAFGIGGKFGTCNDCGGETAGYSSTHCERCSRAHDLQHELDQVRQSYRDLKGAVLEALGVKGAWAITSENTQRIVERIERLRLGGGATVRGIQEINAMRSARWMAGSPGWTVLEVAGELAGEVGELANVCKKLRRSEMGVPGNKLTDDELRAHARLELADVFIVTMLTASKLGVDLEDATREAFNRKSEQMGFPERILAREQL